MAHDGSKSLCNNVESGCIRLSIILDAPLKLECFMQRRLMILCGFVWLLAACGAAPVVEPIPLQTPTVADASTEDESAIDGVMTDGESDDVKAEAVVEQADEAEAVVDNSAETTDTDSATSSETYRGVQVGFTEEGYPYMGNPDAVVLIEEFSDFQCPFCARFHSDALAQLIENELASGDALFVFRDFPLSIHPQAPAAANAARCAGEQGAAAYWQMHDKLFETLGEWGNPNATTQFIGYAEELGLDTAEFDSCVVEERYAAAVQADFDDGAARGIRGTPGFIVNGQALSGAQPYQVFSQAIARGIAGEPVVENTAPNNAAPNPEDIEVPVPQPIEFSDNVAAARGNPDAPVVLIEFTDYQCPFCARHTAQTMPSIVSEYIDTGRVYYMQKDLPLDQIHPLARQAAVAARCAGEFEKYWEMHDVLFGQQAYWSESADLNATLVELAEGFGIDSAEFSTCLTSGKFDQLIEDNVQEALEIGISGTPFFIINGFPVINGAQPFEVFEQVIELAESDGLVDAIMDAQRRQIAAQQQQQAQQQAPPAPTGPVDVPIGDAFTIGDPNAPVVIVEYTDYQCPFCSRHHAQTFAPIVQNYVDQGIVYYVFKDFPLNFHPQAETAAHAARCAGDQDAFLEMHNMLFEQQDQWNGRDDAAQIFSGYAQDTGLDVAAFDGCMDAGEYYDDIQADFQEGAEFGVRGTPAFFINGQFVSGAQPLQVFESAIDAAVNSE